MRIKEEALQREGKWVTQSWYMGGIAYTGKSNIIRWQ